MTQGPSHLLEIHDEYNTDCDAVTSRGAVNTALIFADTLLNNLL